MHSSMLWKKECLNKVKPKDQKLDVGDVIDKSD